MKLRVTRYPNNETRIALYPEKLPKNYLKELSLSLPESQPETDKIAITPPVGRPDLFSEQCESTFNIKSKVDTVPRKRHLALSRNGKRQILRAGSCFDNTETTERLLLTGTLPGTGNKAHRALSEFSSYASKTLTNWLTRRQPGCAWMYTWEFQKRGALHIHCVVELSGKACQYVKDHFKDQWNRILRAICRLSKIDLFAKTATYSHSEKVTQADVTVCNREPSRYISKYISKSGSHAKAFGRFPPRTWYQVSRSLLKRLRDSTQIFEAEGLSYRQARTIEEDAIHYLSDSKLSGSNRFKGTCYSWSGYCYRDDFDPKHISEKLTMKNYGLISTQAMCNRARSVMKHYPANCCYIRAATHPETLTLMEKGMLSETEMLLYIESVIRTLSESLEGEFNPTQSANFLQSVDNWWSSKFGYPKIDLTVKQLAVTICEEGLTGKPVRTKVQTSPLTQLNVFSF